MWVDRPAESTFEIASSRYSGPAEVQAALPSAWKAGLRHLIALQRTAGNLAVCDAVGGDGGASTGRVVQRDIAQRGGVGQREDLDQEKDASARFEGDQKLTDVSTGASTLMPGATGLQITKLQTALIELKFLAGPPNGTFDPATKTALLKFQKAKGIPETGRFDADTMKNLNTAYDSRKPYVDNAAFDPLNPGTHTLTPADQAAAIAAMVAAPRPGASLTFKEDLGAPKGKYGPRIEAALRSTIKSFHKSLFAERKPLRAAPAKNFHSWAVLEAPAAAARDVVDAMYGSQYGGAGAKPAMTHAGGNLIDQWEDELAINAGLTAAQKKAKATEKIWYLINSNLTDISIEHSAIPSRAAEKAILTPIVESFVSSGAKVQGLLDLDIGWEGAQLQGKVYLQRFKSAEKDAAKAKEANRVQMWELFHTCIHEYLHTLAHKDFNTWARSFETAGDETRYNTLVEGFCDFFTLNVRSTLAPATVQVQVEGPYANGKPPAAVSPGVYPSHQQAEQMVSIVGISNAQRGYFAGDTKLMGKP